MSRKLNILELIQKTLAELSMSAEEATRRLAQWGRGTIAPFLDGREIDMASDIARENMHLVKKYTVTDKGVSIELHDAKDAVIQLAKIHGLFTDKDYEDAVVYEGTRYVDD